MRDLDPTGEVFKYEYPEPLVWAVNATEGVDFEVVILAEGEIKKVVNPPTSMLQHLESACRREMYRRLKKYESDSQ